MAYGTNDSSRNETAEEYAEHTGRYIKKLAELFPNAKILGILPIYRNDQNHQGRMLYRNYSLADARAILRGHYEACPNEFGFSLMSQGVIRKIQEILLWKTVRCKANCNAPFL